MQHPVAEYVCKTGIQKWPGIGSVLDLWEGCSEWCVNIANKWFILHVRLSRTLCFFFAEGDLGENRTRPFRLKKYQMLYTIQSQCLYCFRHWDCWDRQPLDPYFRSLLAILQCSKRQGSCLLQVCNTHTPYSSKFYGDVLQHEGLNKQVEDVPGEYRKGRRTGWRNVDTYI